MLHCRAVWHLGLNGHWIWQGRQGQLARLIVHKAVTLALNKLGVTACESGGPLHHDLECTFEPDQCCVKAEPGA